MAEDLQTVAERIVDANRAAKSVKKVSEGGEKKTYADFKASSFGMDWSKTDDFGDWQPSACGAKDGDVYRVWFQR